MQRLFAIFAIYASIALTLGDEFQGSKAIVKARVEVFQVSENVFHHVLA